MAHNRLMMMLLWSLAWKLICVERDRRVVSATDIGEIFKKIYNATYLVLTQIYLSWHPPSQITSAKLYLLIFRSTFMITREHWLESNWLRRYSRRLFLWSYIQSSFSLISSSSLNKDSRGRLRIIRTLYSNTHSMALREKFTVMNIETRASIWCSSAATAFIYNKETTKTETIKCCSKMTHEQALSSTVVFYIIAETENYA